MITIRAKAGAGVVLVVRRTQITIRDVSVNLRSRNIAVPQQRLDRSRVGAMLQQVSSKAVTQRVRRNIFYLRLAGVPLDHGPRKLPGQPFPPAGK